jgi:hypothetical protein
VFCGFIVVSIPTNSGLVNKRKSFGDPNVQERVTSFYFYLKKNNDNGIDKNKGSFWASLCRKKRIWEEYVFIFFLC